MIGKNLNSIKNYLDTGTLETVSGKLKTGIYQGNKPHVVIDLSKTTSKEQIKEIQQFLYRNKVRKLKIKGFIR